MGAAGVTRRAVRRDYRKLTAEDEAEEEDTNGLIGRGFARVGLRRAAVAGVAVAGTAAVVNNNRYNGYYRNLAVDDADAEEDEAGIVGRPLTPVSAAGVTRRAVRRNY